MKKPGSSQFTLVVGLIMQGVGGAIYVGAFTSTLRASLYSDSSGSTVGMVIGAIVAFVGWILILSGVSRASAGIDYLVSVASAPISGVERREQESRRAASQAHQEPPSASSLPSVSG